MTRLLSISALWLLLVSRVWAAEPARLENVRMEWQNAYGVILYTVLADVKNTGAAPLQYVKIKVELFDRDGRKVAEKTGYNVGAESLADGAATGSQNIKPIGIGGSDLLRLSLEKGDIGKPFRRTEVTIVEAR